MLISAATEHFSARQSVAFAVKQNGPNGRAFWAGAGEENEPDYPMSPPAEISELRKAAARARRAFGRAGLFAGDDRDGLAVLERH